MSGLRVAVLGGGRSSEHEVSLASAASIREGLHTAGHLAVEVEVGRDGVWRRDGEILELSPGRGLHGVDVVFPALHGPFGEDGTVQGLLECLGLPYVGAGVLASALCMDKVMFKDLMALAGVPQVEYRAATIERFTDERGQVLAELEPLGLPVFVKPARLGSSVGIVRVQSREEMESALRTAFEHDSLVIVEAAVDGLEVECSVLGNSEPIASQPGEIMLAAGESGWYDYEAKYTPGGMELIVPARIPGHVRERVRELAIATFQRTGCCGLARVDFFVSGETVLVNELNTMPGFTATSVFAALFDASGIAYPELLDRLLELALERHAGRTRAGPLLSIFSRVSCEGASGIRSVAVIGGGFMGAGIAESVAVAGMPVIVRDVDERSLERASAGIEGSLARAVSRGRLERDGAREVRERIEFTTELSALGEADLVVEAVPEDERLKIEVMDAISEVVGPDTIVASNTSSIPIAQLAQALREPSRVIGLHFFSPVPVMRLVEVVVALDTDDATIAAAKAFVAAIGKTPIETKDRSGFIVNMLLVPYLMAAVRMYEEGFASRDDIDTGMRLGCGHPMGPLTLCDFIGLDVLYAVCDSLYEEFKRDEYAPPPLMKRMVASGRLGRKSGRGFYEYE